MCPQELEGSRSHWMVRDARSPFCLPKPRTLSLVVDPKIYQSLTKKILPDTYQRQTRQPCPGHFTLIERLKCRTPALGSLPSRLAEQVTHKRRLFLHTFCNILCAQRLLYLFPQIYYQHASLSVLLYKHLYLVLVPSCHRGQGL